MFLEVAVQVHHTDADDPPEPASQERAGAANAGPPDRGHAGRRAVRDQPPTPRHGPPGPRRSPRPLSVISGWRILVRWCLPAALTPHVMGVGRRRTRGRSQPAIVLVRVGRNPPEPAAQVRAGVANAGAPGHFKKSRLEAPEDGDRQKAEHLDGAGLRRLAGVQADTETVRAGSAISVARESRSGLRAGKV